MHIHCKINCTHPPLSLYQFLAQKPSNPIEYRLKSKSILSPYGPYLIFESYFLTKLFLVHLLGSQFFIHPGRRQPKISAQKGSWTSAFPGPVELSSSSSQQLGAGAQGSELRAQGSGLLGGHPDSPLGRLISSLDKSQCLFALSFLICSHLMCLWRRLNEIMPINK